MSHSAIYGRLISTTMREGQMTLARNGCTTCKGKRRTGPRREARRPLTRPGRAISCDRARPNCMNCSQSNRKCQGYGLRLSWPRANDRRRAVVSKLSPPSPTSPPAGQISDARFVHTTHWDIELYHSLTGSVPVRTLSSLDPPTCWNPSKLETLDPDLLEYCMLCQSRIATDRA